MRRLRVEDAEITRSWRNSPGVARYMYTDHSIGEAEHQGWIQRAVASDTALYWVIVYNEAPVGLANFAKLDRLHGRADWAFYIADPSTRGTGIGSSVEIFMLDQAFDVLKLQKLCCEVLADNEAVWKMHEKFGFVREGLLRRHIRKGEHAHDVVVMGLLAEEWEAHRAGFHEKLSRRNMLAQEAS